MAEQRTRRRGLSVAVVGDLILVTTGTTTAEASVEKVTAQQLVAGARRFRKRDGREVTNRYIKGTAFLPLPGELDDHREAMAQQQAEANARDRQRQSHRSKRITGWLKNAQRALADTSPALRLLCYMITDQIEAATSKGGRAAQAAAHSFGEMAGDFDSPGDYGRRPTNQWPQDAAWEGGRLQALHAITVPILDAAAEILGVEVETFRPEPVDEDADG